MNNPMKNFIASLSLFASCARVLGQGVVLGPGQSYTFEFTSLQYLRPAQTDSGSLAAYFAPGTFSDGESVLLEVFANTLADTPVTSYYTHSGPANPIESVAVAVAWRSSDPPFFSDLQGITRVTMLSGDAELDGFGVQQVINGGVYSQFFAVPEPSTGVLFAAELSCAIWFMRKL
jgi:hypothetical protein